MAALLIVLILSLLLVWLVPAIHEAGHLLAGWMVGFRFVLFVAGPIRIERHGKNVRVRRNRYRALGSGTAISAPTHSRQLRARLAMMYLGGPIASLVFGILLLSCSGSLKHMGLPALARSLSVIIVEWCAVFSLLGGCLFNMIPFPGSGIFNDVTQLLQIARPGALGEREIALLALYAGAMSGQRPRDYNPAFLEAVTSLHDDSAREAVGNQYAYMSALDRGDVEAAGRHLDRAVALKALLLDAFVSSLLMEAAYYTALYRGEAATARAFWEQAQGGSDTERVTWLRAEAAVLRAEGNQQAAASRVSQAWEVLASNDDPSTSYEREWLEAIVNGESDM